MTATITYLGRVVPRAEHSKRPLLYYIEEKYYILSGCQRSQKMSRISEGNSIRSWFYGHRKIHHPEKESDYSSFIVNRANN